jgi:exopolysaccharide biosynthesis polyprenyl glycosylphosphotransferase
MTQLRRRLLIQAGTCLDLAICSLSLLFAAELFSGGIWHGGALLIRNPVRQLLATIVLGLCWHYSLVLTRAYRSYRGAQLRSQALALGNGAALATVWSGIWLLTTQMKPALNARTFVLELSAFFSVTFCSLLLSRICAQACLIAFRQKGRNLRSVLIIGSNRRAVHLADRIVGDINLGYYLLGFVDDFWHDDNAPDKYKSALRGPLQDVLTLLRTLAVDEVLIALPIASNYQFTQQIMDWCKQQGIAVAFESSLFENSLRASPLDARLHNTITLYDATRSAWAAGVKRTLDVIVSATALLLLSPILILIAVLIKMQSPGPVFFLQERLGVGKRRFKIFKFRTMVQNAESLLKKLEHLNQSGGPTFKLSRDPRITPLGAFLRKTSLDELPQLLNVLLGDMSLVGPRPLPLRDYEGFSQDWHRRRFSVRPGITCIWQITGRSSITFERWMELDMDYIDRWSIWLDLSILLRTIPAIIRGSGAM